MSKIEGQKKIIEDAVLVLQQRIGALKFLLKQGE
jgi:hypothetical protein